MSEDTQTGTARFQFVKELGRGVLGEAYEVIDEVRNEHVVLKLFLRSKARNLEEFRLEFQSLTRLNHANLARFYHLVDPASETHDTLQTQIGSTGLAITEEFVDGYDLLSFLRLAPTPEEIDRLEQRRHKTGEVPSAEITPDPSTQAMTEDELPADEYAEYDLLRVAPAPGAEDPFVTAEMPRDTADAQSIVEEFAREPESRVVLDLVLMRLERVVPQIIAGMEYLHKFHKVHASLRPSNIRVSRSGDVKLTDYGIVHHLVYAKETAGSAPISFVQTPENVPFLAPEVADARVTAASDAYALGCVLFEAISGQTPHDRMEWTESDRPTLAPPPLAEIVPECPASWASIVDGLLHRIPGDRPTLRRVLEVVSGDEARPVLIPPTAVEEPNTFVGRREVLEWLKEDALQTASDHTMRYVQLEGDVGIGKSNLLKALSHWLGRRGWLVLKGRFFDPERRPFQGWDGVVRSIRALLESLPAGVYESLKDDIDAASCMFPELGGAPLGDEAPGRLTAIAGFRNILARLSEERPILLLLHDLQWASWDSASLLLELLADSDVRCLVVGTWQADTGAMSDHLLRSDLTLTLFHATRVLARGYDLREAEDFARLSGGVLRPAEAQAALRQNYLNPLLLRELRHEGADLNEVLEGLLDDRNDTHRRFALILNKIYQARMSDLTTPERAILELLAVASTPVSHDELCHAVELEVSSKVVPTQGNETAIESSLANLERLRLVRETGDDRYVLSQSPIRDLVLESLDGRAKARISGRIADVLRPHAKINADELFAFLRDAGRVADAVDAAVEAAERAEARYAYHRAAGIWRWLYEHEKSIPDWAMIRPIAELARVEQLAGRHSMAAELFHGCVSGNKAPAERALTSLKEAHSWMQASSLNKAFEALRRAMAELGLSYEAGALTRMGLLPQRIFRGSAYGLGPNMRRPTVDLATLDQHARAAVLYFATDWNEWFDPSQGSLLESRLSKHAEDVGDAVVLGMARLKSAQMHAAGGLANHKERALEWVDEAKSYFAQAEEPEWLAQALVHEGLIRMWYDDFGPALKAFAQAEEMGDEVETHDVYDHRRLLYLRGWTHIRRGELDVAEHEARHILHTYRSDGVGRVYAHRLLAELSLLRGDTERAERVIDGLLKATEGAVGTRIQVDNLRLRARLDIARGRAEVAVGQIDVAMSSTEGKRWQAFEPTDVLLNLTLGQALAAEATREKHLSESVFEATLGRLQKVCKRLVTVVDEVEPRVGSEIMRLQARYELLRANPRAALKAAERAIALVGVGTDPLTAARCAEVRGVVLQRLDRTEGKASVEQAWNVYAAQKAMYPLVLEGWFVPKPISALRDDDGK